MMSDFNYKKYSLEHLEEWIYDALSCDNVEPQEIYDVIINAIQSDLEFHRLRMNKLTELLTLFKGHRQVNFDSDPAGLNDYYDGWDSVPVCEELDEEDREICNEYNLREAEYYNSSHVIQTEINPGIPSRY
jgi:hypothetical protein